MVDGQLESIWSQSHYATRTLSPVRLVLKVTLARTLLFRLNARLEFYVTINRSLFFITTGSTCLLLDYNKYI